MAKHESKAIETSLSPEQYMEILQNVTLDSVWLSQSSTSRVEFDPKSKLTVDFDLQSGEPRLDADHTVLDMAFEFGATKEGESDPCIKISAIFSLRVLSKVSLSPEFFAIFEKTVAQMVVWPYCREFTQSSLARMGLPPFTLPLVMSANVNFVEE